MFHSGRLQPARVKFFYGWVVVVTTFLVLLASAGVRSTPGVLIVPLEKEFGWSPATISAAVSINLLLYGLGGPFAAALMQRFGVRRVVIGALLTIATAVGLTTLMQASWQLILLWGVVVGGAAACMANVMGALVANRWFVKRRGLVLGVLSASSGTGQLLFLPLLATLAVNIGWRASVIYVAAIALLMVPVVFVFMRELPSDLGLRPFGQEGVDDAPATIRTNPLRAAFDALRAAIHHREFWILSGSFFICGASTNGLIGTHLIPASIDHGIPEVTAASMLAVMGVFDLVGTTASGWLSDRIDNRLLLTWYYSLRGLSLLFLPYLFGTAGLGMGIFVVFYGLDWLATVPPTVRLATKYFGKEQGTITFGWIFTAHQLGAATIAFGAGAIRTLLGDYQVAFMTSGLLCLVAAGMVVRLGRSSRSDSPPAPVHLAPAPTT